MSRETKNEEIKNIKVMAIVMSLESLAERAAEAIKLIKLMDKTFPYNEDSHINICMMAVIQDAYLAGQKVS